MNVQNGSISSLCPDSYRFFDSLLECLLLIDLCIEDCKIQIKFMFLCNNLNSSYFEYKFLPEPRTPNPALLLPQLLLGVTFTLVNDQETHAISHYQ